MVPRYPVFFYDPVRLAQDLESNGERGNPFIAGPPFGLYFPVTEGVVLTVHQASPSQNA